MIKKFVKAVKEVAKNFNKKEEVKVVELEVLGKVRKFKVTGNTENPETINIRYNVFQEILRDLEQCHKELKG